MEDLTRVKLQRLEPRCNVLPAHLDDLFAEQLKARDGPGAGHTIMAKEPREVEGGKKNEIIERASYPD